MKKKPILITISVIAIILIIWTVWGNVTVGATHYTVRSSSADKAIIITVCRIVCSILLLFYPAFSHASYILYIVAGVTDMIDGTIARKTNTANEFGTRLETIAVLAAVQNNKTIVKCT